MSRAAAARLGGMGRQTLRDWVHRFNAIGPSGVIDRKAPGAAARLTREQEGELASLVLRRDRTPRRMGSYAGAASI
jgi:transposase